MKYSILILALFPLIQACAPVDSSSETSLVAPRVIADQPQGQPITQAPTLVAQDPVMLCQEDVFCKANCDLTFTFTDEQAIIRKANATGFSTTTLKVIAENRLSILNHDTCLKTPINEIKGFLASPLTMDVFEGQPFGTPGALCIVWQNETWNLCK